MKYRWHSVKRSLPPIGLDVELHIVRDGRHWVTTGTYSEVFRWGRFRIRYNAMNAHEYGDFDVYKKVFGRGVTHWREMDYPDGEW